MAVIVTKLDAPTDVSAALLDGGNLSPNTTYYVVVTAKNFAGGSHYYAPVDGELISEASEEISFTTTDTKKSVVITWTRPVGSTYYNVYMTKVSGDYTDLKTGNNFVAAGKRCSRTNINDATNEMRDSVYNTNTLTVTIEPQLNTAYINDTIGYGAIHDVHNPNMIMGLLPKGNGTINISFTGTYTLKQICDELTSQGYGDYFYYNNNNLFILRGSISVNGSAAGSLKIINHTLIFFSGTIQNTNPNCNLQLGDYTANRPNSGCVVCTNVLKLGYTKAYDTKFDSKLLNIYYPYNIYVPDRTTFLGAISSDVKSCFFYDYAIATYADLSNQYLFSNLNSLRTYITNSNNSSAAWQNTFITAYGMNPQWYAFFRDCTFNITQSLYMMEMPTYANREHHFFDCIFIGDYWKQDYSTHRYYWYEAIGVQSARWVYNNSITLNVTNQNGNPIENATVVLLNKNGDTVLSTTTDVSGNTTKTDIKVMTIEHDITTGAGYDESKQYRINYNPFTLTISKKGYDDYVMKFTFNKKLDAVISLNEVSYYHQLITGTVEASEVAGSVSSVELSGIIETAEVKGTVTSNSVTGIVTTQEIAVDIGETF